jgi:hypothetical protein
MQLRLGRHQLLADHVHLLRGPQHIFGRWLVGFSRRGCFPSDVVERIFVVLFEVRMFEFPRL